MLREHRGEGGSDNGGGGRGGGDAMYKMCVNVQTSSVGLIISSHRISDHQPLTGIRFHYVSLVKSRHC